MCYSRNVLGYARSSLRDGAKKFFSLRFHFKSSYNKHPLLKNNKASQHRLLRWFLCGGWRTLRCHLSDSGFTQLKDLQDWISLGQIFILKIIRLPSIVSPLAFLRWLEDVALSFI